MTGVHLSCEKHGKSLVGIGIPRELIERSPPKYKEYIELLRENEIVLDASTDCCCNEYIGFHPDFDGEFVFYKGYYENHILRNFIDYCKNYLGTRKAGKIRETRLKEAIGSHTDEDLRKIAKWQEYKCYFCFKILDVESAINDGSGIDDLAHWDHLTPISRGGSANPSNMALTCISCNLKKSARTEREFWRVMEKTVGKEEVKKRREIHGVYRRRKKRGKHAWWGRSTLKERKC